MKDQVTEDMHLENEWFKEAKDQTLETLTDFNKRTLGSCEMDYGSAVHAVAACALAAYYTACKEMGLTGAQHSFAKWDILREGWGLGEKTGARIINYDLMIYPQDEWLFAPVIPIRTFAKVQELAKEKLETKNLEDIPEYVVNHWQKIARGEVPFNWTIDKEDD